MADLEEERHLSLAGQFDCDPEPLPTLRHSAAHLMAQAVRQLFPDVRLAIGPAIEDGFYYDFQKTAPFTPADLERVEARMGELAAADLPFTREEWTREQAIRYFEDNDEPFKVEILRRLEAPQVSIYRQGDFLDLCRGPHVGSTGAIRARKRDHRKLGRELELFEFHDVAPGAPFWLPKGMVIVRQLEQFWREMHDARGYLEVSTPILVN